MGCSSWVCGLLGRWTVIATCTIRAVREAGQPFFLLFFFGITILYIIAKEVSVKYSVWVFVVLLFLSGCAQTLVYTGSLTTNGNLYTVRLVVRPAREEGRAVITVKRLGEGEFYLSEGMIDLMVPSGAQSIPLERAVPSRFILTRGQSAQWKMRWRLINDPAFYQLYGLAGDRLPEEYILQLATVANENDLSLRVRVSPQALASYEKGIKPILFSYKIAVPEGFEDLQRKYLKEKGWISIHEHEDDEHDPEHGEMPAFFMIGDYTILMDGRYYVGWYGFATEKGVTLRLILANREVEILYVDPEKLTITVEQKEVKPVVKKSLMPRRDKKGFPILRNQRGEWLLFYPVKNPPENLFINVQKAFLSAQDVPLFALERIELKGYKP